MYSILLCVENLLNQGQNKTMLVFTSFITWVLVQLKEKEEPIPGYG